MDVSLNINSLPNNNLLYNINMTSKSRIRNSKYLNTLSRNARGETETKIKEVIKLYSESIKFHKSAQPKI